MKLNERKKKQIVILGSTGSIGRQALEVIEMHKDEYAVLGLTAKDEADILLEQIYKFKPKLVAVTDRKAYELLKKSSIDSVDIVLGEEGLCEVASLSESDVVIIALSGAIGILPTISAIKAGKRIALANKETLVAAGDIVMRKIRETGVTLIPVDSEHSAIFQCLGNNKDLLKKIHLTASGGPFRNFTYEQLGNVSADMALKHPNWVMGPKITIDSATLMNKGLEVIEAHHIFGVDYKNINVIIQKESMIHSMVEYIDGSFIAHLGVPDMRIPIQYAMTYPTRMKSLAADIDFATLGSISFEKPDMERFPSLRLAYEAGNIGGTMPAVLNAANEVAADSFLQGKIKFTHIPVVVEKTMLKHNNPISSYDIETILEVDNWARRICTEELGSSSL